MTGEIRITKTLMIIMTWMVMQQTIQNNSLGFGGRKCLVLGWWEWICLRTRSRAATPLLLSTHRTQGLLIWVETVPSFQGPAASTAKGVLDGQGGRQLGRLEAMLTSVSHFNSNLKFISNTRDSSLSHSLLLFFSTDILIWMWLAGSKLWIVLIKSQLAGNTCQSMPLFLSRFYNEIKMDSSRHPLPCKQSSFILQGVDTVFRWCSFLRRNAYNFGN